MPMLVHCGKTARKSSSGVAPKNAQIKTPNRASAPDIVLVVVFLAPLMAHAKVVAVNIAVALINTARRSSLDAWRDLT